MRRGLSEREIKRGPGGIRDIEFALQLLQLVHGRLDPALRTPTTLRALAELQAAGYVGLDDADQLGAAYRFLRRVEHALQLEDEHQVHVVPDASPSRARLARILGYRSAVAADAVEQFDAGLSAHRAAARAIHERLWFRPLLEAFAGTRRTLSPDATAERLAAFGFADVERTRQAVADLTRGLTRSSRLMQQLLPLVLDWLSESPDPDLGLLTLRRLTERPDRATQLAATFREAPDVARALCLVIGTSEPLGDVLRRNPDLIPRLSSPGDLRTRSGPDLVASATSAVGWRPDAVERQEALQRWQQRHLLGIAARDLLGHADHRPGGPRPGDPRRGHPGGGPRHPRAPAPVRRRGRGALRGPGALLRLRPRRRVRLRRGRTRGRRGGRAPGLRPPPPARQLAGPPDLAPRRRPAPRGSPGPVGPQPRGVPHLLLPLGPHLGAAGHDPRPTRGRRPVVGSGPGRPTGAARVADAGRRRRPRHPAHEGPHRGRAPPCGRGPRLPPQVGPGLAHRHRVHRPAAGPDPRRPLAGHRHRPGPPGGHRGRRRGRRRGPADGVRVLRADPQPAVPAGRPRRATPSPRTPSP